MNCFFFHFLLNEIGTNVYEEKMCWFFFFSHYCNLLLVNFSRNKNAIKREKNVDILLNAEHTSEHWTHTHIYLYIFQSRSWSHSLACSLAQTFGRLLMCKRSHLPYLNHLKCAYYAILFPRSTSSAWISSSQSFCKDVTISYFSFSYFFVLSLLVSQSLSHSHIHAFAYTHAHPQTLQYICTRILFFFVSFIGTTAIQRYFTFFVLPKKNTCLTK